MCPIFIKAESLVKIEDKLGDMKKKAPAVLANALNRTQTKVKKIIPKAVKRQYTDKVPLQTPRKQRASKTNLRATLFFDREYHGLQRFKYKKGKPSAQRGKLGQAFAAKVVSDGSFKGISRAFLAPTGLSKTVFRRTGDERLPIKRVVGPSEHSMVNRVWKQRRTQRDVGKELSKQLDEQINNQYLKKWGLKK